MKTLVQRLVDFASKSNFEALPADAIDESKRMVLDSIGCAFATLSVDKGKRAVRAAREMGGPAEARVIGTGDKLSLSSAAFANGELINGLDYDVLTVPPGHVTPYVLPAILAMGEKQNVSGKALISAIAVAHEISARFGPAMANYRDIKQGEKVSFPVVSGFSSAIFGGTLGVAMLRGLDALKAANALGLAGHMAPAYAMTKWATTLPSGDDKYLMSGWINQAELLAVLLAAQGYRGDQEVLEGDYGFWRFMGSGKWNPDALTDGLGEDWRFPKVTIFKPYPCCRINHTVLDCLVHLMAEQDLKAEEIEQVTAYCDPHCAVHPLWNSKTIMSPGDAQMNVAYALSMAAHRVKVGPEWHDDETLNDKRLLAFMEKVEVKPHPDFEKSLMENSQSRIGRVEVRARGKTFKEERRFRKGSPATPETRMSDDELVEKFRHNAARVLPSEATERLVTTILRLEDVVHISDLTRMW